MLKSILKVLHNIRAAGYPVRCLGHLPRLVAPGLVAPGLIAPGLVAIVALAAVPPPATAGDGRAPAVAAASDLRFVLPELTARFASETGAHVRLSFGASGNLSRQIAEGAPFELFLSADEAYVLDLVEKGLALDRGRLYAIGRLALFVPTGSPLRPDPSLADLAEALEAGKIRRFAIANPEHAPYGRAAREALRRAGLWSRIKPRLALGENVSQAAQFATVGGAEGGLIAHSLALAPGVAARGRFSLVRSDWHAPLRQRMVLLEGAGATARAFYDYLATREARALLARSGFEPPGGAP